MKQLQTTGIILSRVEYGEADRILTLLTPDVGKLRLMARGVRKIKSKLAGGIELFSISDISYIQGRGEIGTLVSARLDQHFGKIVQNIDRVQLGYELIKTLNKATEDQPEPEYFELLQKAFRALDDQTIAVGLIQSWFAARLLQLAGHTPNLTIDTESLRLVSDKRYDFSFEAMAFQEHPDGMTEASAIKFMRLLFSNNDPRVLQKITGVERLLNECQPLIGTMLATYIRI